MRREVVEEAIRSLDALLEADVAEESPYQDWMEQHPVALQALGYGRSLAHPRIESVEGLEWVPDFLVQAPNSTWEILELKTPQAAILLDRAHRSKFYAAFESYVQQCREYARAFDDPRTADTFISRYGIPIHKDLRSTIVAGRSIGLDTAKVHLLGGAIHPPVALLTYDDLRARLEHYRTFSFGEYEKAKALGLIFVLAVRRPPTAAISNHLLDVGGERDRNRVSVFVNPQGHLRLDLLDAHGARHSTRSILPLEEGDYDMPHVFVFSIGVGDDFGFLSIEVDRKYRVDIRIENFPFTVSHHYVLGSDITGAAASWMCVGAFMVLAGPPSFEQKAVVQRWADEHHIQRARQSPEEPWVVFGGRQSLRSENHPIASAPSGAPRHGPCPGFAIT
jgi:hypothetical protein